MTPEARQELFLDPTFRLLAVTPAYKYMTLDFSDRYLPKADILTLEDKYTPEVLLTELGYLDNGNLSKFASDNFMEAKQKFRIHRDYKHIHMMSPTKVFLLEKYFHLAEANENVKFWSVDEQWRINHEGDFHNLPNDKFCVAYTTIAYVFKMLSYQGSDYQMNGKVLGKSEIKSKLMGIYKARGIDYFLKFSGITLSNGKLAPRVIVQLEGTLDGSVNYSKAYRELIWAVENVNEVVVKLTNRITFLHQKHLLRLES